MVFHFFQKWINRRNSRKGTQQLETEQKKENPVLKNEFSPMTYQNPFIMHLRLILEQVISKKNISKQKLELVIIDAEENRDEDDDDIENVLFELVHQLNYLLLVTDRIEKYEYFMETAYEESGLVVQQIPKTARIRARGNLVLDFERSGGISAECMKSDVIYVPVYKRPWEIGENLDIMVPVGYNTLVVSGIFPLYMEEKCLRDEKFVKDGKLDRLDREFRKD